MASESQPEKTRIHILITRVRVTVLGFTLTITVFLAGFLFSRHSGIPFEENVWANLTEFVALFLGFTFAFVALWLFIISEKLDQEGTSGIWLFSLAEMAMYVALSQTVSAVIEDFVINLSETLESHRQLAPDSLPSRLEFVSALGHLQLWLYGIGGLVWLLFTYFAPIGSLFRNPLPWGKKWLLVAFYFLLLSIVFVVSAYAYSLKALEQGQPADVVSLFLQQFFQPRLW